MAILSGFNTSIYGWMTFSETAPLFCLHPSSYNYIIPYLMFICSSRMASVSGSNQSARSIWAGRKATPWPIFSTSDFICWYFCTAKSIAFSSNSNCLFNNYILRIPFHFHKNILHEWFCSLRKLIADSLYLYLWSHSLCLLVNQESTKTHQKEVEGQNSLQKERMRVLRAFYQCPVVL